MKLPAKSIQQVDVNIEDYYAVRLGAVWRGFKEESAAFKWLCFYIILEYVRPASLYPVIDVLPWTQLALLFAAFTAMSEKSIKWVKTPATQLDIVFMLLVLLSSVLAFRSASSYATIDVPLIWVFVYILIINVVNTERRFILFLLLFFLINFKMSQHGFSTFAMRGFSYSAWGVAGSPGWFRNAGDFGIAMAVFVPLLLSFIFALRQNWGKYKRWFFYFVVFTAVMSVLASSSRGAQLGLVSAGLWFVLKSEKAVKALLIASVLGVIMYSSMSDEMLAEYQDAGEDDTSENRLAHWAWGWEVAKDYPVLGVGYSNWLVYCDYHNPNGVHDDFRGRCLLPHNTYVELLAEMGWVGMVFYLWIVFYIFVSNVKTRKLAKGKGNSFVGYISHGLDGGLVAYLISSIFYSVLFYPFLWITLAMTVVVRQLAIKGSKELGAENIKSR